MKKYARRQYSANKSGNTCPPKQRKLVFQLTNSIHGEASHGHGILSLERILGSISSADSNLEKNQAIQGHRTSIQPVQPMNSMEKTLPANEWGVVQCGGRDQLPDTRPTPQDPEPSPEGYADHVQKRTLIFFVTVLMAIYKTENAPSDMFSDHAEAQIGSGARLTEARHGANHSREQKRENSFDAAHRMNTTLRPDVAIEHGMNSELAQHLYEISAGTSNQFQVSNLTADKAIDKTQTEIKNEIFNSGLSKDELWEEIPNFITLYLNILRSNLEEKLEIEREKDTRSELKIMSYEVALRATEHYNNIIDEIMDELNIQLSEDQEQQVQSE